MPTACPDITPVAAPSSNIDTVSHFSFSQWWHDMIPRHWDLLDSQLTINVFNNIRNSDKLLKVHTNVSMQVSTQVSNLRSFGATWLNPKSLANILSMAAVRKARMSDHHGHRSRSSPQTSTILPDGMVMKFTEHLTGLCCHDATVVTTTKSSDTGCY